MEWIKIPTDNILYSEFKDSELMALIKYQALYCQLEKEPTSTQLNRVLNARQRKFVMSCKEVVQELIKSQVDVVKNKRNRDKESYKQKQQLSKKSDSGKKTDRELVSGADKIRLDKIRKEEKIYKKFGEFENVKLTDEEFLKLKNIYGKNLESGIEILSDYLEQSGKKYKSHYAVMKTNGWVYEKAVKNNNQQTESDADEFARVIQELKQEEEEERKKLQENENQQKNKVQSMISNLANAKKVS
jgi:hypothetical protein